MSRLDSHPILEIPKRKQFTFTYNGRMVEAFEGEVISSALIAAGYHVFGHHHRDGAAQGIFCANGQCAQCLVLADGVPVKGCMTPVQPGMKVSSCEGKPELPAEVEPPDMFGRTGAEGIENVKTSCLILGGGPAGLAAAIELGKAEVDTIVVDDKQSLGGKLTLQTHLFFGSKAECYAGTRGIDIAEILTGEVARHQTVEVWLDSPAVGVFCDGKVGVVKQGRYVLIEPAALLVAAGAREKSLAFPGCDLPGVYGAGAFQTLVNRDLVKPAERLFVCGGGNVGLIAAYHALQAGIEVAGLAEAASACGGYRVHLDKIVNLGVPVYTSHTVVRADGGRGPGGLAAGGGTDRQKNCRLQAVTIARVDENFSLLPGTERTIEVDSLLIAVGLTPVNEFYQKAKQYGMKVFAAGDAEEISEASAAMFSGKIAGRKIVDALGGTQTKGGRGKVRGVVGSSATEAGQGELSGSVRGCSAEESRLLEALRSRPGPVGRLEINRIPGKIYPVIRCTQQIPCDPCVEACSRGAIKLAEDSLLGVPEFQGDDCSGCGKCVIACPGLAIVLVDEGYDPSGKLALVTVPFEFPEDRVRPGDEVATVGSEGKVIGKATVKDMRKSRKMKRNLLRLEVPFEERLDVAGIRLQYAEEGGWEDVSLEDDDTVICRCERVTKGEIVRLIREGYRDMNQLKAALRVGMGACGGKTCEELIFRLFKDEGIDLDEVTGFVKRPPAMEVPLSLFAGLDSGGRGAGGGRAK